MTVRRFLPFLLAGAMLLSLAAIPQRADALDTKDLTVVAFGDSITASGAWFANAEKTYGIKVINKAVGGWNSKDGRSAFSSALALKPDVLFLSFGMNDSALDMAKYVPLETYRENMRYMIEGAQNAGAKVILVIENPIGEEDYYTRHDRKVFEPYGGIGAFYLQYVEEARALAKEYALTVMDMYRIFSEDGRSLDDLLADGVHPSAKGYALYASALVDALAEVLPDEPEDPSGEPSDEPSDEPSGDSSDESSEDPSDKPSGVLGDVTGDGKVNAQDYLLIKRHVLGTYSLGERGVYADVDRNGKVNAADYMMVKRHVLGTFTIA